MSSIKKRIEELEVAKTKAEQRPMTDAEMAVRATAILNNPGSPAHAKLVELFECAQSTQHFTIQSTNAFKSASRASW